MREASDPTAKADVAAVVMQEGLAHICLITPSMTHVRQKIEQCKLTRNLSLLVVSGSILTDCL